MMTRFKLFLIVATLCCLNPLTVAAQSFYSQRGLGLVKYFVSGQSVGMGGVGLAVSDWLTVNYMNPAALVSLPVAFISGTFAHESLDLSGSGQDGAISNTNVRGFQFHLPIKKERISMAMGLTPYSSIEYSFKASHFLNNDRFTETLSGSGGANIAFFSLAVRPFKKLALGATGLLYFGNLRTIWRVVFDNNATLINTQQENTQSFTDTNFRLGFQYEIYKGWRIAGVYSPSVTLNADQTIFLRNITEFDDLPKQTIKLPASYGIGTAFYAGRKLLVGLDYYVENWSGIESDGFVNDSQRLGIGFEYSGRGTNINSNWFSRSAFRLGFYYRDLGLEDPVGESVTEVFGTVGLGFPLRWTASRVDLGLEIGKRGSLDSNPIKEKILRFTASVTVGEGWFFRRGRR